MRIGETLRSVPGAESNQCRLAFILASNIRRLVDQVVEYHIENGMIDFMIKEAIGASVERSNEG
jgi:hypothetical protein